MPGEFSIFYSWQSDTDGATNRHLIRSCLDVAVSKFNADVLVEDAARVDDGMAGVPGTPEVATTMFEKIDASSIFVADISLTGESRAGGKYFPNPNVSTETGYAAHALGWDRVIRVMNESYGPRDQLPFDERNRRFPITYNLASLADDADGKIRATLTKNLLKALRTSEASELRKVERVRQRMDVKCLTVMYDYRSQEFFSERVWPEEQEYLRRTFELAIPRLLDLGLLFANLSNDGQQYAYHWTYLGKKVIQKCFPSRRR